MEGIPQLLIGKGKVLLVLLDAPMDGWPVLFAGLYELSLQRSLMSVMCLSP